MGRKVHQGVAGNDFCLYVMLIDQYLVAPSGDCQMAFISICAVRSVVPVDNLESALPLSGTLSFGTVKHIPCIGQRFCEYEFIEYYLLAQIPKKSLNL